MARANVTVLQAPHNNVDWAVFAKMFQDAMKQRQIEEARQQQINDMQTVAQAYPVSDTTTPTATPVQVATSPIPGQSSQASDVNGMIPMPEQQPVQAPTTTTETAMLNKQDPYKEGLAKIQQEYKQNVQSTLPQLKDPHVASQFLQQQIADREAKIATHKTTTFQSDMAGLLADNSMSVPQKIGAAMDLNKKYGVGMELGTVLNFFKQPKADIRNVGGSLVQVNEDGTVKNLYTDPNVADKMEIARGKYDLARERLSQTQNNQSEKSVDTPWGKIPVSKFIDIHKEALGGETISERKDPLTGETVQSKTMRPAKPEILKWSQPIYDKINATPQTQNTNQSSSLGDPLMDATLAEIRMNGAEVAQGKLSAKVGEEKAKQIINQISLFLQEK